MFVCVCLPLLRYYSIAVEDNSTDISVSIDPLFGDPDMYVSPADPEGHFLPTRLNFTWQAIGFGADTLQMQVLSMIYHCTASLTTSLAMSLTMQ